MNVNNYEAPGELPKNLLTDIFKKQHELAKKYVPIEQANGLRLSTDIPGNVDDNKVQFTLKDMFWRTTEELAEALEALDIGDDLHFHEEIADSLHFLVEACLIAGVVPIPPVMGEIDSDELTTMFFASKPRQPLYPDQIQKEAVEEYAMAFIKRLGLTANCLKNKPWKQSHMLTDVKKFRSCLNNAFLAFIDLCKVAGFNSTGLYNMYIRKNEVNKFRQGSGY